jgi:hypothetical protein
MSAYQMWSPGRIGKSLHNRTLNPNGKQPSHRSILRLEVSVWEPIGRVRLASASVNCGCGDTSLSRNAHGGARWLANWHPDWVSVSRPVGCLIGPGEVVLQDRDG